MEIENAFTVSRDLHTPVECSGEKAIKATLSMTVL